MIALPDLSPTMIPAKIDTGARTSSLHATDIERFDRDGHRWLRFALDIGHGLSEPVMVEVPRIDHRTITSSNGETESRPIIKTQLRLGNLVFPAEFSLRDRSEMKFPVLIGRAALRNRFFVDSGRSWLQSKQPKEQSR